MTTPTQFSAASMDLSSRIANNSTVVGSPAAASITSVCALTFPNFGKLQNATGVYLEGTVSLTIGTSGVSCLVQIRQTGTAGAVIASTGALTVTATNLYSFSVQGVDTAPLAAGVWIIAVTIGSGAATSTVSAVSLFASAV
jgi:hypothetical protein